MIEIHNIYPQSCQRGTAPRLIYAYMFRHNSKSSVSEEVKAKPRCFSVVADGKFTRVAPDIRPDIWLEKTIFNIMGLYVEGSGFIGIYMYSLIKLVHFRIFFFELYINYK